MPFKAWQSHCVGHDGSQEDACGFRGEIFGWDKDFPKPCPQCGGNAVIEDAGSRQTVMIATDDIPGGLLVRHAICHEDGTPKRYYSKTEIKRALNKAGYTIGGDTPKLYPVHWDGIQNTIHTRNQK